MENITLQKLKDAIDLIESIDKLNAERFNNGETGFYYEDVIYILRQYDSLCRVFYKFEEFDDGLPSPERLEKLLRKALENDEAKPNKESVEKFKLTGRKISTKELFYTQNYTGSLTDACRVLTDVILNELQDGDGENGGMGSLKNCYGDIWDDLWRCGNYSYADCEFDIVKL